MRYTLQDYSDVLFSGFNYKLPENVNSIIAELTKEFGAINNDKVETRELENTDHRTRRSEACFKRNRYSIKGKVDDSWKMPVPFKATVIEKKEGLEKQTNDIRVCLNKISNKNYLQQRDAIFELIERIVDHENSATSLHSQPIAMNGLSVDNLGFAPPAAALQNLQHVSQSIFDIASSNKFYSELYAELYKDLIGKFSLFSAFIINLIDEYYESMNAIKNIDSNEDYNLYCENNKINDKRKATSMFIVNLMKKGVLPKIDVLNLVIRMQENVIAMVDIDDKTYEIDEITENLFILITLVVNDTDTVDGDFTDMFHRICENTETCSKYKTKDHKSISSRAIFKYMDMLDKIGRSG